MIKFRSVPAESRTFDCGNSLVSESEQLYYLEINNFCSESEVSHLIKLEIEHELIEIEHES